MTWHLTALFISCVDYTFFLNYSFCRTGPLTYGMYCSCVLAVFFCEFSTYILTLHPFPSYACKAGSKFRHLKKFPTGNIAPYITDYLCSCNLKIVLLQNHHPKNVNCTSSGRVNNPCSIWTPCVLMVLYYAIISTGYYSYKVFVLLHCQIFPHYTYLFLANPPLPPS